MLDCTCTICNCNYDSTKRSPICPHNRLDGTNDLLHRDPLLVEREKMHGDFKDVADVAQQIKAIIHQRRGTSGVEDRRQFEALDLIATKISRIVCGNPLEIDHWKDIAGYAKLGEEACYS